ncbi:hypothetical protein Tco_0842459 [Tanacetum coccineum]|uniref:Uncharacterized protein n=1 Tax=Tanacetum coccineum TaxID=301880 RepID=A0ABQ5B1H9_9ASTR
MDDTNKGYETCEEEEEEGYGEEDGSSSTEEYDLEDDCEAELDEITQTLIPLRYNLNEEIIEDGTVKLRRTKVRLHYDWLKRRGSHPTAQKDNLDEMMD